ncbi:MAG: Eco57I restriction-modification methylase domain-containing protein [Lysobacter sp.]|nr:Eco57I restriction-modification methylase domain-containing protein [Lysobacter sp.]
MTLTLDMFDHSERSPDVEQAISRMAGHCEIGRGAIFTRPEVVEAILDLLGYSSDLPLHNKRLLEPSFGAGDFLLPAAQRLLTAFFREGGTPETAADRLESAIFAVELHEHTFDETARRLAELLGRAGLSKQDADLLCSAWLVRDDFLLARIEGQFDFVVGNPPYVRQERIPAALLAEYRRRFQTLYDRADIYIPFFERALDLLGAEGALGFICANRWLKNRYGGPLRDKIAKGYWLKYFINMEGVDAFHSDVIAYPAITVLQRADATERATRAVGGSAQASLPLGKIVEALLDRTEQGVVVEEITLGLGGSAPILLDDIRRLTLLRRLERLHPTIEQAGCRVGIGVATGCDRVYIASMDTLPVEQERKLPLVMARDLVNGKIEWGGKGVLNPFEASGQLASLDSYPAFKKYLLSHREAIEGRNVAKRNPDAWYKTIDRIQPGLLTTPKILVPDIKGEGVFVIDEGNYYPHHNLYFITSAEWDLRALLTVLRSSLTLMTVATYCTRMSGGFLRFQAQYLRRIRLPRWCDVEETMRTRLIDAASSMDQREIDVPVSELYQLSADEAQRACDIANAARVGRSAMK